MNITPVSLINLKNTTKMAFSDKNLMTNSIAFTGTDSVELSKDAALNQKKAEIKEKADKILTRSEAILEEEEIQYKDVMDMFYIVEAGEYKDLETNNRTIKVSKGISYPSTHDEKTPKPKEFIIISEYDKETGKLSRISSFRWMYDYGYIVETISGNINGSEQTYTYDEDERLLSFETGIEYLPYHAKKIAEKFYFNDDASINHYEAGIEYLPDHTQKIAQRMDFESEKGLTTYRTGCELSAKGNFSVTEKITF